MLRITGLQTEGCVAGLDGALARNLAPSVGLRWQRFFYGSVFFLLGSEVTLLARLSI